MFGQGGLTEGPARAPGAGGMRRGTRCHHPSTEHFRRILPLQVPPHTQQNPSPIWVKSEKYEHTAESQSQGATKRRPTLCIRKIILNEYFKLSPLPQPHYLWI